MHLSGIVGRVVYALLAAVVTLVVLFIVAIIIATFNAEIADIIKKFAPIIALLVGLVYFFTRPATPIV